MATPAQKFEDNLPILALVGRANVGKSTLFNRLIEERKALVSDISGTTRTNNEGICMWRGKEIRIVDTGGVDNSENEYFSDDIIEQSKHAMEHADIIVVVCDAQVGPLPQEIELSRHIRKNYSTKKIILVANKTDVQKMEHGLHSPEWSKMQLGDALPLSSVNGRGIGDFLDEIYSALNKLPIRPKKIKQELDTVRVTLIGKPNVGKSSLFNKLIGEDKVIVSDKAHTTREPFDTVVTFDDGNKKHIITFVDTAGMRRKSQVRGLLEREGIGHSIQSIDKSDIILLVIDGSETISSQDMQLAGLIERRSKSVVILVNKWDMTEDTSDSYRNDVKKMVYAHFPHLDFAPILFVSGKTGYRVHYIFPLLTRIIEARKTEIPQNILRKFIEHAQRTHKPSRGKGTRQPKILGMKQLNSNPPIFEILVKYRTSIHRSYINFIENRLREENNFFATPIVIKLTKMKRL